MIGAPAVQSGQAIVEFAVVLGVLLVLIAGGVELGSAYLGSSRASEAAKAGVEEWLYATGGAGVYDNTYGASYEITASPFGENVGLGDHGTGAFTRPTCGQNPGEYDDGLPADAISKGGTAVYLFNPLPIDITQCVGTDASGPDNRTRLSLLIEALPPLNRALYSLYQMRCADTDGAEVGCSSDAVAQTYYRLPGRLDAVTDTVTLAILDGDPASATFQMPLPNSPLPTFDLECAPGGSQAFDLCDTTTAPADICWATDGSPLACEVRVRVRYRHIFYSILQYPFVWWNAPLPPDALAQMDVGPDGVDGVLGGEVARGGVRFFQRTFQGCHETVTVAPSAGMLGSRTLRACN